MIKTKIALIIFATLLIYLVPFSYFIFWNDSIISVVPGWNTTIDSFKNINILIKFLILCFVVFAYWKLSKANKLMNRKIFFTHFILTLPAVIVSKFSLVSLFVEFQTESLEKLANDIKTFSLITLLINIIFIIIQIVFAFYFFNNRGRANS